MADIYLTAVEFVIKVKYNKIIWKQYNSEQTNPK